MCDRYGPAIDFEAMRSAFRPGRRSMLRATAASALTMAVGSGLMGQAHAQGTSLKATHGTGFCNLNFFLAHALQLARQDGTEIQFINTPTSAEMVTFLGMGQVDLGLMPYTSFMALFNAGAPVKIIAGGGVEGCSIVAQRGLDSPEKLRGKTLGTFQLDTLEVLPYDYLKKHGISMRDVTVRYMGNTPEAVEAFKAGALDWICTIEPYATALVNEVPGAVRLSDGTDVYGPRLHRLRAGHALQPDPAEPGRDQERHQGDVPRPADGRAEPAAGARSAGGRLPTRPRWRIPGWPCRSSRRSWTPAARPTSSWTAPTASWRWAISATSPAAMRSTGPCSSR